LCATATTRAMNRAISGLVGMGEVSAEEVDAGGYHAPAVPAAAMSTPDQYEQIKALFKASGADPVAFATMLDQQGAPEANGIAARVAGMSKVQADALIAELSEAVA
jgi:hypothetical protein